MVSIIFEIIDASSAVKYTESHTITTNDYGLVSLVIGQGATSDDFSAIDWGNGTYSVKIKIDGTDMETAQLWSVPYANYASNGMTIAQADAITANTVKTGISTAQADAITANTAKSEISTVQADAITANTAKTGISTAQADAITANTVKTGITTVQADAITANTAKSGITTAQADAITANTLKVGYTEVLVSANTDVAANTAKTGISTAQADAITANTTKVAGATATEIAYLSGVTSAIQTQLDAKGTASSIDGLSDALVEDYSIYIGNDPSSTTDNAWYNVSVGTTALDAITAGDHNTAIGSFTLYKNISGNSNTASGYHALYRNTMGYYNTAIGYGAGDAITTGNNNVIIGYLADPSSSNASNQIVIGKGATGTGDNEITLSNTSITAIKAQVTSITGYSDKRIKREIHDSNLGLDFINKLRPVKYKFKNPADYPAELLEERFSSLPGSGPNNENVVRSEDDETIYDGLIAQEVKATIDALGVKWSGWSKNESDGKEGIQYGALTVPLIKAIQEQQEMIQRQQKMIEELRERLDHVEGSID